MVTYQQTNFKIQLKPVLKQYLCRTIWTRQKQWQVQRGQHQLAYTPNQNNEYFAVNYYKFI